MQVNIGDNAEEKDEEKRKHPAFKYPLHHVEPGVVVTENFLIAVHLGGRLAETPEEERPGRVVMVITTDGYENASRRYSRSQIQDMIRRQTDVYKWKFMFLGANMDAVSEADSMGIRPCMAATYSPSAAGVRSVFSAVGRMLDVMKLNDCDEDEEEFREQCEAIMSSVR